MLNRLEQRHQFILQRLVQRTAVSQFLARDAFGQVTDDRRGGFNAHIRRQQAGFQVFEQVIVDDFLAQKQAGHTLAKTGAGFRQALLEALKETNTALLSAFSRRGDRFYDSRCGHRWFNDRLNHHRYLNVRMQDFTARVDPKPRGTWRWV